MSLRVLCYITILLSAVAIIIFLKQPSNPQMPYYSAPPNSQGADNRLFFWDVYPTWVTSSDGEAINMQTKITNLNNDTLTFNEIINNENVLVLRFSKFDCDICVNLVIEKMTNYFRFNYDRVILLTDGYSIRDIKLKYKDTPIPFKIFIIPDNSSLGLNLEGKNFPFLFVLRSNLVTKIYIPFKEWPAHIDNYLENITTSFGKK